jgi:formylglycine-generating enzyme required for sulfatase activity
MPVYVFIRASMDGGATWYFVEPAFLQGDGYGVVSNAGVKKVTWWGSAETGSDHPQVRIRGLRMARIPEGEFTMKSFPAGGKDPFIKERPNTYLPEFYMSVNETTIGMYSDYLNETVGSGWNEQMSNEKRCGIVQLDRAGKRTYHVIPGRENFPITYVSWYDATAFLRWCGLSLPTEAMFEKAFVGGLFLDGNEVKAKKNPNPERKFPWGDEPPDQENVYRCNFDGDDDGFSNLAPVGTFADFPSPYGINDLAGNVAEWTIDWYTTAYHVGLDGFRMVRGGSWLATPVECDAVSGATQFPIKESSIMGFRGVMVK